MPWQGLLAWHNGCINDVSRVASLTLAVLPGEHQTFVSASICAYAGGESGDAGKRQDTHDHHGRGRAALDKGVGLVRAQRKGTPICLAKQRSECSVLLVLGTGKNARQVFPLSKSLKSPASLQMLVTPFTVRWSRIRLRHRLQYEVGRSLRSFSSLNAVDGLPAMYVHAG